ncbi:MAG: citrate synthase [Bacillales bacterium]|nr:citrate synthase [Bacillales bacterium]
MTLIRGLEGIVATVSSISSIIDDTLTYVGYDIDVLAENAQFEEVIFLLWFRRLPKPEELQDFKKKLTNEMVLPKEVVDFIRNSPLQEVHPMTFLRSAISMLAMYDKEAEFMDEFANLRKSIRIQAKIPLIVTTFQRLRKGLEPVEINPEYSFAKNFLYTLTGKEPSDIAEQALNKALVLHADHELNASTFTARVCVATLSDVYSGITSAIGALKGPLHGGANEAVMHMLSHIGDVSKVDQFVDDAINNKMKIMGFGHRVYRNGDPRAKHLKEMSSKLCKLTNQDNLYEMSSRIESKVMEIKNIPPNVDFYSASVYHCLEIDHDLFTPIFAISRTSGWLAHILEQYDGNRLIRPRADYSGPINQKWVNLEERK